MMSMLGREQERWLADGFARSRAQWNIVGQQLLIAELEHLPYEDERYWNDAWDGYPRARQRLLEEVVRTGLRNPVFLTGDWHSTFVNDLKLDFKDPGSATVATEFVTPAITTGGDDTPYGPYYGPMVLQSAHQVLRGRPPRLLQATITPTLLRLYLRFVTSVEDPRGTGYTEASFIVEDGIAGAPRA
jgi:alkaline phosphatase D